MAKKLTKAQIAKNPTKAINSGQMKMRKQEVPFGGIGKAAAKVVGKVIGKKTAAKGGSRQAGDYAVSGKSAKQTMIKVGSSPTANYRYGRDAMISKNVTIKDTTSPSGKQFIRGGASQVMNQNSRLTTKLTKSEVKANARGLKAANKPTKAGKVMKKTTSTKKMENVPAGVSSRFNATLEGLAKQSTSKPTVVAGKKDMSAFIGKRAVRNEQMSSQSKPGFSQGKTKLLRQIKASNKKSK